MQERYEVARVKTDSQFGEHHKFDRREINSANCSKNIVILFGATLRRRMRVREMDKTESAKSYLSGYVLDIYLAIPKRSVAAAPNISMN